LNKLTFYEMVAAHPCIAGKFRAADPPQPQRPTVARWRPIWYTKKRQTCRMSATVIASLHATLAHNCPLCL